MPCHPLFPAVDLLGFLMLGLMGSFGHCVGMCSPFVLFVSRQYPSAGKDAGPTTLTHAGTAAVAAAASTSQSAALTALTAGRLAVLRPQLWYHAGRISTYAVLGALGGALGRAVEAAGAFVGLQRAAMLVAGGVLVAWGLMRLSDLGWLPGAIRLKPDPTKSLFGRVVRTLKGRAPGHPFAAGLFLGLLPCGLLYSAVVAAVARGSALEGAVALSLFGVGTAPALLGVSLADAFLARNRALLNHLAQLFVLAMGAWFLWRGFAG